MFPFQVGTVVRRRYIREEVTVAMIGDFDVVLQNEIGRLYTVSLDKLTGPGYRIVRF